MGRQSSPCVRTPAAVVRRQREPLFCLALLAKKIAAPSAPGKQRACRQSQCVLTLIRWLFLSRLSIQSPHFPRSRLSTREMARRGGLWGSCVLVISSLISVFLHCAPPAAAVQEQATCSGDAEVCEAPDASRKVEADSKCQLYLAQSSIPNAGLGVYTSVDYRKGDYIGEGELLIPITDLPYTDYWLVDDVQWDVDLDPRLYYESNEPNSIYYPGFGAQINCHMGLNNAEHSRPKFDSAGLHRSKDPGAGAFTNWYDMPNIATRDIESGEELFVNYGDSWFDHRAHIMGRIPMARDFARADHIVRKMHMLKHKNYATTLEVTVDGSGATSVWSKVKSIVGKSDDHPTMDEAAALADLWSVVRNATTEALARALPERHGDLDEAYKHGAARQSIGGQSSIRSNEWLEENGMCLDNFYVNISSIPQAGRGAFAKRLLPKDSVVAPAPVLQVNRSLFYHKPIGYQLMMNYAFGHPDSQVFLLPYSSAVNFINHDSKSPNVKLRWSNSTVHRPEFLMLSADEVLKKGFGLVMEFVALRDIQPDEEILFDYGAEWELAWKKHVKEWTPAPGAADYLSADDAHKVMGILTEEEQKKNAYPKNIQTACYFYHTENTQYEDLTKKGDLKTVYRAEWSKKNKDCLRWCSIRERHINQTSGEVFYDVLILPQKTNLHELCVMSADETVYVDKIPSDAVTLVDRKLTRDQHLPNAFRRYIGLSDELFPSSWRQTRNSDLFVKAEEHAKQCALYLAKSSIPDAGIGIFTAVDYKDGDSVGDPEILVPFVHFTRKKWSLLQDVTWNSGNIDPYLLFESASPSEAFIPGFGAQINCHMGLNNVRHDYPSFDSAGMCRKTDPGVGAFSSWYNLPNIATRDIVSGEELFTDYGEAWFENRKQLGTIPFEDDYTVADNVVEKMQNILKKEGLGISEAIIDYWDVLRQAASDRVSAALPTSLDVFDDVVKYGTARFSLGGARSFRSREWLEENGICVDNLYAANSTIPGAGRGAFAKRFVPAGSIVAPAPMLQMHRGQLLYKGDDSDEYHRQLLTNYCYGHRSSSVLLVPYSPIVNFINHNSQNPNVKIRWANSHLNRKDWLELPPRELLRQSFGLTMEFVALRDIHPNEEISLDYGPEWEDAWNDHLEDWSGEEFENYVSPDELNDKIESVIRTAKELESNPYPENILTACFYTPYQSVDDGYQNISNESGVQVVRRQWKTSETECLRPCKVVEKTVRQVAFKDHLLVTAEMLPMRGLSAECMIRNGEKHIISSIPEEAIVFVDDFDTRDPYIEGAFRHIIAIPDEEFPKAWLLSAGDGIESGAEIGKEQSS